MRSRCDRTASAAGGNISGRVRLCACRLCFPTRIELELTLNQPWPWKSAAAPDFRRQIELIRISAIRQLKVRYRGSALGVFWSFANPILMTAIYTAIFGTAFARYYDGSVTRYVLSAFVGVVVVTYFQQATTEALSGVVANGGLLNKIELAPETFPLAAVAANTFQQAVTTFPLLMVISLAVTHDVVRVLLVPVAAAGVVLLVGAFGLALSALFVFFRDTGNLWGIAGFILWLTSPVFYPAALVPESVRLWVVWNPVAQAISAVREVTLTRGPIDFAQVGGFLAVTVLLAVAAAALFASLRRDFIDLV
jgi:lipopolysaccharide transport system permease protein